VFGDCVNTWPAVYQQFSKCLSCVAVGPVYHGIFILHFLFMIWTEQSGSDDSDSDFCLGVTWLSSNKHPNYTDWSFKLYFLVPPGQYWNSTSNWTKIFPFTFIPVHSYGWPSVYTWLHITTALILQLVSVQQLTIFRETKCITKLLLTYIIKWSSYPRKRIGIYISQMCTVVCTLSCLPMPYWQYWNFCHWSSYKNH
jgi:hypothetical protein